MKHLSRSRIEYLDYVWNFYTGCLHKQRGICPVPNCWARDIATRFRRGDFEPHLVPDMLLAPLSLRKPSKIGVCFTGDLFGDWVDPERPVDSEDNTLKDIVKNVIRARPEHQFLFLTKAPENYKKWGEFPENAWLGASTWNTRTAIESCLQLGNAKCLNRWLSIEPCLASVNLPSEHIEVCKIGWTVIGAQSSPVKMPEKVWLDEIIAACKDANIPYWEKNNLKSMLGRALHQELPKGKVR